MRWKDLNLKDNGRVRWDGWMDGWMGVGNDGQVSRFRCGGERRREIVNDEKVFLCRALDAQKYPFSTPITIMSIGVITSDVFALI